MRFIFADSAEKLQSYTEKGWLYFFLTQLQPNDRQAFIKFGLTERSLIERLNDYSSLNIFNIYAIRIPCEEVSIRECAMKRIFKICKKNDNIDIWEDRGIEYLKGDLNLMLRVFLYFCTCSLEEANLYKNKQHIVESENMINWLLNLPDLNKYNINMLSFPRNNNIDQEVKNITITDNKTNENKLNSSSSSYSCPNCGKELKDSRGVKIHLRSCTGEEKQFICPGCNLECANYNSLVVHKKRCKVIKKQSLEKEILQKQEEEKKEIIKREESLSISLKKKTEENETLLRRIKEIEASYQLNLSNEVKRMEKEYRDNLSDRDNEMILIKKDNEKLIAQLKSKEEGYTHILEELEEAKRRIRFDEDLIVRLTVKKTIRQ
jgi:hypothetical protein